MLDVVNARSQPSNGHLKGFSPTTGMIRLLYHTVFHCITPWDVMKSLMVKCLGQASQGCEMYCQDLEIKGQSGQTWGCIVFLFKSYLNQK